MSDDDPHDEPDDTAPEAAPRRDAVFVIAVSLAVVFGLAAVVLSLLTVTDAFGDGDDRLDAAREAAGRFGEALVTYDYREPDAHREAVLALSTGSFRQEYEDAFEQGLAQIITEVEATSTGFVKEIYVSELGEDDAQAIVVVDIEHTGTGGPRTLFDVYFRLTFVEVDGVWKVDQVTDLNFDTGSAPTDPGDGTSSTTVPDSTTTSIP
jgi:hypothetical protein